MKKILMLSLTLGAASLGSLARAESEMGASDYFASATSAVFIVPFGWSYVPVLSIDGTVEAVKGNWKADIQLSKPSANRFLATGVVTPDLKKSFAIMRERNAAFCQALTSADDNTIARQIITYSEMSEQMKSQAANAQ